MFDGSSQLSATAERAVFKSLSTVQTTKQCSAVGAAEHLIDGSENLESAYYWCAVTNLSVKFSTVQVSKNAITVYNWHRGFFCMIGTEWLFPVIFRWTSSTMNAKMKYRFFEVLCKTQIYKPVSLVYNKQVLNHLMQTNPELFFLFRLMCRTWKKLWRSVNTHYQELWLVPKSAARLKRHGEFYELIYESWLLQLIKKITRKHPKNLFSYLNGNEDY